jgi:hypothetical protein
MKITIKTAPGGEKYEVDLADPSVTVEDFKKVHQRAESRE